ncbi:PREDICTED: TATA box-binding protein-associated factor RNA polymerase I subunit D [Elephantulus edwardii]|uniref:TATA box-binding protein-associated factor RNA polymerase I subunit D n=1 Tax=Elephantulus edwardii TaxID=28737 RepID=UPI0003F0D485|nr:PREDICTED: TATA box-binding protein-associated factor RNA polymerase I subunit D [Elephantulus edwardii]
MISNLATTGKIENQSDTSESSDSGSSLFKTQYGPSLPTERQEKPLRKFVCLPKNVQTIDSSDSDWEPRPLTLKAVFERFKQRKRKKKKKKYKPTGRPKGRPNGSKNRSTKRSQIDKNQFKDRGPEFSFLDSENGRNPIPWKKILTFEQAVARGFFKYIEKLKYEHHLKESLKQMNVAEDLEKDDLDSRAYKYLDDDGSISPIEESVVGDEDGTEVKHCDECDIKLVGENDFILSCDFPKKRKRNLLDGENVKRRKKFKGKKMGQNGQN